jgi:hypothetical protein
MTYGKPEVTELGSAALAIQGPNKILNKDPGTGFMTGADCDLDD